MGRRAILAAVLALALAACGGDPAPGGLPAGAATDIELEGHYRGSFETSSFVPCSLPGDPGYGNGFWLDIAPGVDFNKHYAALTDNPGNSGRDLPGDAVYLRLVGDLTEPRDGKNNEGYGHLNQYDREVTVKQVLEMSFDDKCGG